MDFRLLGPLEVVRSGQTVALGGVKPRALLALLLLHANEVVSRDGLIDALWPERAPGTASHSLDVQVSRLRKAFDPAELLLTRSGGYLLQIEPTSIDAHRFEQLLERGRRANAEGRPKEALAALSSALDLWRGSALGDLAYEEFARTEAERLEELRLVAIEERIDAELALGQHDRLVPELEALTAKHPLRERLRGQHMLALYRAGRQAEALRVYSGTRKRLVEDLGIEPGQALKDLEQAILRQDPALDLPKPLVDKRHRLLAGAAAVVVAGVAVAAVVLTARGGTESAQALTESNAIVFLSEATGDVTRRTPVLDAAFVRFGAGSLWSLSTEGVLTRIDPATGKVIATIGLNISKPGGMAFGRGSVWVTDAFSPTVVRVDPAINDVVKRIPLPMTGVVTDLTGGVSVGAGSVWVGHGQFNPGAWIERLDPDGTPQGRVPINGGDANSVAFGDRALWVGSEGAGELREIDPKTTSLAFMTPLRPQSRVCCLAVGGGFAWAGLSAEASIWKVDRRGKIVDTIKLPAPVRNVTYASRALWVALGEGGVVTRIDPTTDTTRTYEVGHNVVDVDAHDGLVVAAVQPNGQDVTADLEGDVVRIGLGSSGLFEVGGPLFPSTDPALYAPWDKNMAQFDHATCAKLYDYPDVEGAAGRTIQPEVAADFPTVSDRGRTYAIKIRDGFRFSPPSNEPVTAESFRDAIERDISPTFAPDYLDPRWNVLVGAKEYNAGKSPHVSGVSADGDNLVLRLTKPAPDLPRTLALNVFCAVPAGTPITPHGLKTPISSAGPYYLAALTDSVAVLKPNPNYGGSRPQHLDAIVFEFGIAPKDAAARVANGTLDYVFETDPALAPGTEVARAGGKRYRLTPDTTGSNHFLALNWRRPLFRDREMRRAVQYALDRRALAEADPQGSVPAANLLSAKVPGFTDAPLYPLRGDLRIARRLADGRKAHAVVAAFDDSYSAAFNRALREQLAAIGISVTMLPLTNADFDNSGAGMASKAARSDLYWGGLGAETSDPVAYLQGLFLPAEDRAELERVAKLVSPERDARAAALARKIERESLFAVYDNGAIPELVSKRLGCIVHQPEYAGVDLAALCLKSSGD